MMPDDAEAANHRAALAAVLTRWAENIELHRPDDVAAVFTEDTVFQGSDPSYSVGRAGVASYYAKRPLGLRPEYRVRETRALGADAFAAFLDVDFVHPGGRTDRTHLTVILVRTDGWSIQQYHVSTVNPTPTA